MGNFTRPHQVHQLYQIVPTTPTISKYTTLNISAPYYTQLYQSITLSNYNNYTKLQWLQQSAVNSNIFTKVHQANHTKLQQTTPNYSKLDQTVMNNTKL